MTIKISSQKFLTSRYQQYPLYRDVIIPLIDWALEANETQLDYITGKYTNYLNLDKQVAIELINELGYGYILDAVSLTTDDARIIFGYLKLFHTIKGTKQGLRFVIELLGYDKEEIEWFENQNQLLFTSYSREQLMGDVPIPGGIPVDPYVYKVNLTINLENLSIDKLRKFKKFSRNYVYDVLLLFITLKINLFNLTFINAGFIRRKLTSNGTALTYFTSGGFIRRRYYQEYNPPPVPTDPIVYIQFNNYSNFRVIDSSLNNNDFIEVVDNANAIVDIEFFGNTQDSSPNGNDFTVLTNSVFTLVPLINIQFQNDSTDSSPNGNNLLEVLISSPFPSSITGSWGTLPLNYTYVFSPQYTGDLINYGSSSGSPAYLDRRSSGDNYPQWINDNGSWGLNFTNSPYAGLRIPLDNFPSSNSKVTYICVGKITNNTGSFIFSNIADASVNGESLGTGLIGDVALFGRNGPTGEGYYTNQSLLNNTVDSIFTISVDYALNTVSIVSNQTTKTTNTNGNFISANVNNIDAVIGSARINGTWTGGTSDLIIKKLAIIYDTLSDAQIKELHNILGF